MASKTSERPRISGRQVAGATAIVAGAVAAIGAGIFFAKDKRTPRPDYETLDEDGAFSIRDYPPLLVAEALIEGVTERKDAQDRAYHLLSDYISAKSRGGETIAMTAPVLCDLAGPGDATKDDVSAGFRMRFIMPQGYTRETLPPPPEGVTIAELPARRVGAIAFSGLWSNANLEEEEAELRAWLVERGEEEMGRAEYALYDAPLIPGPLRRNEILISLA